MLAILGRLGIAAALALLAVPASAQAPPGATPSTAPCVTTQGLSFICGVVAPEDLRHIPGTPYVVAGGMVEGSGLKLIDTRTKTPIVWNTSIWYVVQANRDKYPACAEPVAPARLNTHGLSLRPIGDGRFQMYAVAHGGRESIEVYTVDTRTPTPTLIWNGCLMAPAGLRFNSVTSFMDGEVLATVPSLPRHTSEESFRGIATGAVFQWKPGMTAFRKLPGTDLPGPNGIDASRDGKEFYVVAFGLRQVVALSRGDTATILRRTPSADFMPDNVAWDGDRLIAAGSRYDDPACGGPRRYLANGQQYLAACNRGYVAAEVEPISMTWRIVDYAEPNPAFGGVAHAIIIGDEIWLSSFRDNRIGWRKLPRP